MKTVIGIDNGTQSTKVVFYDFEKGRIAASAQASYSVISRGDGTREQKAEWWIDALGKCFSDIDSSIKETAVAVGVSGQQHGFVPLDSSGEVLYNVKLWCDTSTAAECSEIEKRYGGGDKILNEAGNRILPGYTASKILWLKKNHPEVYMKMKHILLPHNFINFYLTGNYTMESGDASGTGLLNIKRREWDKNVLNALDPERDLSECLPPLLAPYEVSGHVTAGAASEFGIKEGIPVSSGGGDNMMGAVGTGAVKPGVITMSLGTSGTIYGFSDKPVIDPNGNLAAFCSSTGGWLPLLCTMNCTVATEMMRSLFDTGISDFNNTASQASPGSGGIITLPFFNGERTPNLPNGRGCVVGMDMTNLTRENIFRSSFESAVLGMKLGLDSFSGLGFQAEEIRLIGGGAKSGLWRQIAADILDLPVAVPLHEEAAALGGAVQALWALDYASGKISGIEYLTDRHVKIDREKGCNPDRENSAVYQGVYNKYTEYVQSLSDIFK